MLKVSLNCDDSITITSINTTTPDDQPIKPKKTKIKDMDHDSDEYKIYYAKCLLKRRMAYNKNPEPYIERTLKCRKERIERDTLLGLLPKVKPPKIKIPKEVIVKIPGRKGRPRKDQLEVDVAVEKQRLEKLLKQK